MPPEQCPACGRFLKRALVEGLAAAPAPCPKCEIELTAEMFAVPAPGPASAAAPEPPPGPPPAAASAPAAMEVTAAVATSVRPPDLVPDEVRGGPDPLAGWDAGVPAGVEAIRDQRPFPVDTVLVLGAAAVGAAVGAVVGVRPLRDAPIGALVGAVGAGVARRIWQLP